MKINFYYQTPLISCTLLAAEKLLNFYREEYPDIEFVYHDYRFIPRKEPVPNSELSKIYDNPAAAGFVIIENDENKKYFLICYSDNLGFLFMPYFHDLENCVEVLAAIGVHSDAIRFKQHPYIKYTPIGYFQHEKPLEDEAQKLYKLNIPEVIPKKPFFRSNDSPYLFRKYLLENDNRFDIKVGRIDREDFISELARYSINIDINSVAEISCRTADSFAVGSALIRPKLTIQFHNKLIPDYHYAAVKCDDLSDWPTLADAYIERFEDLKKDPDYVRFLSINGRKWYEENATIDAHCNILKEVIDLNKLK